MHHTPRDVLGEAAYLRRACDMLAAALDQVERSVSPHHQVDAIQEAELAHAHARWVPYAKDQVEMATRYVEEWRRHVEAALAMGSPSP
jgi:hypothetical protein